MKNLILKYHENNQTFLTKEEWFVIFGTTKLLDSLIFYLMGTTSIIGFLINCLSFFILSKKTFDSTPLFKYLKVYVANSSVVCLISSIYFIPATYNLFEFTNTIWVRVYVTNMYAYLLSTAYFFSSYLDIYIGLERVSNFKPNFKQKIKRLSYKFVCLGLFIFAVVANVPFYFVFTALNVDVKLDNFTKFRIYVSSASEFGESLNGRIASGLIFFLRDIATIIAEIILNITTLVLLKRQLSKKSKMVMIPLKKLPNEEIETEKLFTEEITNNPDPGQTLSSIELKATHNKMNVSKLDRNLTCMVLLIGFFSIIAHILTLFCTSLYFFDNSLVTSYVCFSANFFVSFKHFLNFFILIMFNNLFQKEFQNIFKLSRN